MVRSDARSRTVNFKEVPVLRQIGKVDNLGGPYSSVLDIAIDFSFPRWRMHEC
jgi:hypothetical protein